MTPFLKHSATILLTPGIGWHWVGWDGILTVSSYGKPLMLSMNHIIIESDVPLFTLISPRNYASFFCQDVPGTITEANFTVNKPTLSDKIVVNGVSPLLLTTTGNFTCFFSSPSEKMTTFGPIPDVIPFKMGTWKVMETKQDVFIRDKGCVDSRVHSMSHVDKMEASLKQSNVPHAILNELGGWGGVATGLVAAGVILGAIALAPEILVGSAIVAAVGEVATLTGVGLSGYQIGEGIADLANFYQRTDEATTCADLKDASKSFEQGLAKVGVGGVNTVMGLTGAAKAGTSKASSEVSELRASRLKLVEKLRKERALRFYKDNGFNEKEALSHMEGIDFSKPIKVKTIERGTRVRQWVRNGSEPGDYCTTPENGIKKNLGIKYDNRSIQDFTVTKKSKVLVSTAANYKKNAGGGPQLFSPGIKQNITQKR
ncbi:polymorphic toxin type 46 domain-containing protein [Mucilaginibacter paludis]|uniref:Bacterial toxin 46 domain-containing protein n=1 Tax=Mucilaginibacter paludis DSM 18603 TaxID=714943 RepID=H1Y8M5_9SPHI|nr:polymorphic toxin type 46 domain-containing protein [Mucilaginibacter paludis]EHQ26897.1 hypothetical protein Mucpa_2785 [Mucilaginibacter paludis DSM 18603]